ncbi:13653_t:CDS:2, partial [Gigaspora margarita]
TEALATELRLRQEFNDTRIVNIMSNLEKIDNIKKIWKFNLAYLFLEKFLPKDCRCIKKAKLIYNALENCLIGNRRNRKLASEYVISGYNSLALSIALLAKDKSKILGEHYCNIPLADPNQFEIKKCKGYSGNIAKMTRKISLYKPFQLEQNFGYATKNLYQGRKENFELG